MHPHVPDAALADRLERPLRELRISVTDRCNFRCSYCMPKAVFDRGHTFLAQPELLSFEEITRLARLFVTLGVTKLRITGGEPLLRKNVEALIAMLAALRTPSGDRVELTLTTNGSLLARKARALRDAGLQRIAISLDAIEDATFRRMNDVDFPLADVLEGIAAATDAGFGELKVNLVVRRGINDAQILPMASHFRGTNAIVRFIEFMDVGQTNGWRMDDVLPSAEVVRHIDEAFGLEPLPPLGESDTAQRWRYRDGSGEIGVISSVSQPFCRSCSRARLSTDGRLYLCLFAHQGHDLRTLLRGGLNDEQLSIAIRQAWTQRDDRYSELRSQPATQPPSTARRIEMHYIGG